MVPQVKAEPGLLQVKIEPGLKRAVSVREDGISTHQTLAYEGMSKRLRHANSCLGLPGQSREDIEFKIGAVDKQREKVQSEMFAQLRNYDDKCGTLESKKSQLQAALNGLASSPKIALICETADNDDEKSLDIKLKKLASDMAEVSGSLKTNLERVTLELSEKSMDYYEEVEKIAFKMLLVREVRRLLKNELENFSA
jgi:hypothetical protein